MPTRTGTLRDRVDIQSYTQAQSSTGAVNRTWSTDATVWANIDPISGLERSQADQQKSVRTHTVTMRFYNGFASPGIDETMRLQHTDGTGTRTFEIKSVIDPGSRGRHTILDVKESRAAV